MGTGQSFKTTLDGLTDWLVLPLDRFLIFDRHVKKISSANETRRDGNVQKI